MGIMDQDFKIKVDQACRTAEDFTKHYYESIDKKRHLMHKYYLDTGVLVWNGNASIGKELIQKFYVNLPATQHIIQSLDSQPIHNSIVANQVTNVIQVSGIVKYKEKIGKPFQQTFMITAEGDKWRIVTDCFRLQEPASDG